MRYDLDLIHQLSGEIGLSSCMVSDQCVELDLGRGAVLCFQNAEREEDCLVGFRDVPWHFHDDIIFMDGQGNYIELNYLDLLISLKEGQVLICEMQADGRIADRWLVHREYDDELSDQLKYLRENEQILIHRAATKSGTAATLRSER
jgi:hypothetical protein